MGREPRPAPGSGRPAPHGRFRLRTRLAAGFAPGRPTRPALPGRRQLPPASRRADEGRAGPDAPHTDEQGARAVTPYVFLGLPHSIIGAGDDIVLPEALESVDWELELAVVIGRTAHRV